jgi:hypothetical protein
MTGVSSSFGPTGGTKWLWYRWLVEQWELSFCFALKLGMLIRTHPEKNSW